MQKLYCYVDETGQDARSEFFIVVAIVTADNQQRLKEELLGIERQTNIGQRKWHKSRSPQKENFLIQVVKEECVAGEVYFGRYKKPLPFFLPLLETLVKAILIAAREPYKAIIYVDGIDKKKAQELTNALRVKGIKTAYVRSVRDESEPLIRLADRWAGCIRASFEHHVSNNDLVSKAIKSGYLKLL